MLARRILTSMVREELIRRHLREDLKRMRAKATQISEHSRHREQQVQKS